MNVATVVLVVTTAGRASSSIHGNRRRSMPDEPTDAAAVYERLFVPAEFQECAPRVAEAARIQAGQRVQDVACGTGVLRITLC